MGLCPFFFFNIFPLHINHSNGASNRDWLVPPRTGVKKKTMKWQVILLAFSTLFLAEVGDKTQLAVFTLVTKCRAPLEVFLGPRLRWRLSL